jgi:hypothetical protein
MTEVPKKRILCSGFSIHSEKSLVRNILEGTGFEPEFVANRLTAASILKREQQIYAAVFAMCDTSRNLELWQKEIAGLNNDMATAFIGFLHVANVTPVLDFGTTPFGYQSPQELIKWPSKMTNVTPLIQATRNALIGLDRTSL